MTGWNVSRETHEKLERYGALLKKWSKSINLVSPSTLAELDVRHIADCLQVTKQLNDRDLHIADFGSGAGLPGLIIAISIERQMNTTLIESDARKAAFLRTVKADLGLLCDIVVARVEDVAPLNANVVTARALASLSDLFDLAAPHLADNGRMLFFKGASVDREISDARRNWRFDCVKIPSTTNSAATLLEIKGLARAE